ncbi:ABC transporter permease [Megasphaera stantonii]|uniref:Transport permease protein n=1 Tax=Megasphaera stantonii TaxID=2144175 RepID=A0A346B1T3_9FIRM|nr:ABC transporter permease [Megasphaera stantonii]AXL22076.1 ABC transporter permease [Megasphaera stantonii]
MNSDISQLHKYIPLLRELVVRDLKIKYRRSFLGYLWSLMNPLLMMWILTIVFSYVFRFDIPNYPLYLIIGQVVFNFVSESTTASMYSIVGNAALLKKVYVPKPIFPLARVASSFVTMLFSMVAIFIVMIATDVSLTPTLLLLPIPLFFLFIFSLGVSLIVSAVAVYLRDMFHLYSVFTTAWSFLTPIFYPISIVPDDFRWMLFWNPLFYIVSYFREIILNDAVPTLDSTMVCFELSIGTLILGMLIFKKLQNKFLLYV